MGGSQPGRPSSSIARRRKKQAAMQLQLRIARIRPQDIQNARNGIDYPMTEA